MDIQVIRLEFERPLEARPGLLQRALVYVAGPGLSVQSLADILIHAGAERAMELDINSTWVDFVSFRPLRGDAPGARNGSKLLPGMGGDPGRYLGPSTRDFFAVLARQRGL